MALNYLLVQGARLDVVVNLDGFNEVALPPSELTSNNIFPLYPRNWFHRVSGLDPESRRALGRVFYFEDLRRLKARRFSRFPLGHSMIGGLLWKWTDRGLEQEIFRTSASLRDRETADGGYQAHGPRYRRVFPGKDLYQILAQTWYNASLQMHRLTAASGIEYYHFLQPNQYVANSKPLSKEELQTAWREDHMYRKGVTTGYPLLIAAGERLRQQGVAFHDLTMAFEEVPQTLYIDSCCHFNHEGYRLVAVAIADALEARGNLPNR